MTYIPVIVPSVKNNIKDCVIFFILEPSRFSIAWGKDSNCLILKDVLINNVNWIQWIEAHNKMLIILRITPFWALVWGIDNMAGPLNKMDLHWCWNNQ